MLFAVFFDFFFKTSKNYIRPGYIFLLSLKEVTAPGKQLLSRGRGTSTEGRGSEF